MFEKFLLAFVPLLVAMDAFGVFPLFINITEHNTKHEQRILAGQSTLAAFSVGALFLFGGRSVMMFLGITINDLRVAGGVILLCFAVYDLLFSHLQRSLSEQTKVGETVAKVARLSSLAIVPLGIPLIVGPAALTALLLLEVQLGAWVTLSAFALNILGVYLLFANASVITKLVPQAVLRAISKVVALFLAAIAVMMIRTGLTGMLR